MTEAKRAYALSKADAEGAKKDYERQIADLKHKHQLQVTDMTAELKAVHSKAEGTLEKEQIRALKRDAEAQKQRAIESEKIANDLRKQRDELTLTLNATSLERGKFAEQEQAMRRSCSGEVERLETKLRGAEEDLALAASKQAEKQQKVEQLLGDIEALKRKLADGEIEVATLKRRVLELEETIKNREAEINSHIKRAHADEKEQYLLDREEKAKTQKLLDHLETRLMKEEEEHKIEKHTLLQHTQALEKERQGHVEEIKTLRRRTTELQSTYEALKATHLKSLDRSDLLEKELKKLQEKHRNLLAAEQALVLSKDKLEMALKDLTGEHNKLSQRDQGWAKERDELQTKLLDTTKRLDAAIRETALEVKKYKSKAKSYKAKVRQANLKLQQLATRLAGLPADSSLAIPPLPASASMAAPGRESDTKKHQGHLAAQQRATGAELARTLGAHIAMADKRGLG